MRCLKCKIRILRIKLQKKKLSLRSIPEPSCAWCGKTLDIALQLHISIYSRSCLQQTFAKSRIGSRGGAPCSYRPWY